MKQENGVDQWKYFKRPKTKKRAKKYGIIAHCMADDCHSSCIDKSGML